MKHKIEIIGLYDEKSKLDHIDIHLMVNESGNRLTIESAISLLEETISYLKTHVDDEPHRASDNG